MNEVPLRLSWAVLKEFQATAMGCVSNIRTVSQVDPFPAPPFPNIVYKSNSSGWSKFHPLYEVIGGGVKIFSSLKHNLLQQFPYFPSQLVGLTMPHHLLLYNVSGSH
jgi:hypothetical protein